MDIRYVGGALLDFDAIGANRRPLTDAADDAYYARYAPAPHRIPRAVSFVVVLCLGLVTAGLWLQ